MSGGPMSGVARVDGGPVGPLERAVIPVTDPGFTHGWTVFETFQALGRLPASFDEHMERLEQSAARALVPFPRRDALREEATDVVSRFDGPVRVRITLTAGGHRVVQGSPAEPERWNGALRAARGIWRDEPYLGGAVKHGSRAPWLVAVKRSGADEVLLVDGDGRFTEGTSCAILAVIDGVLWTAPHDGRILPSTTVNDLVRRAGVLGIPVRREGPPASGPWDGLYVASVTRDLGPVVELDGEPLPGWDPVGRRLAAARE